MFEQHGVPSASIVTDVFTVTGKAMARAWGLPQFKFLTMPPTIVVDKDPVLTAIAEDLRRELASIGLANLADAELDQRAAAIAPEVVRLLMEGQTD